MSERRRLGRDLHDGAQQRLVSLSLQLGAVSMRLAPGSEEERMLAAAQQELGASLTELREVAHGVHPAILTDHGLDAAVRSLATRAPLPVDVGVDVADVSAGSGLRGLAERLAAVGGALRVSSSPAPARASAPRSRSRKARRAALPRPFDHPLRDPRSDARLVADVDFDDAVAQLRAGIRHIAGAARDGGRPHVAGDPAARAPARPFPAPASTRRPGPLANGLRVQLDELLGRLGHRRVLGASMTRRARPVRVLDRGCDRMSRVAGASMIHP